MGKIYEKIMENYKCLYHITEYSNIESILESQKILSLKSIENLNLKVNYVSSETSRSGDKTKNLDEYVRLAYTYQYDMIPAAIYYERLKNPAVILISPEIILNNDRVYFSNKNAASKDASIFSEEDEAVRNIDFNKTYRKRTYENSNLKDYKNARQAEVLIPKNVKKDYFIKIFVENGTDYSELEKYNIEIVQTNVIEQITRCD